MEQIIVQIRSGDLYPRVMAWTEEDGDKVGCFHGWVMENETLEVGEITTLGARRQSGVASRLVLYAARVLRARLIRAGVSSAEGEQFFENLKHRSDIPVEYYW